MNTPSSTRSKTRCERLSRPLGVLAQDLLEPAAELVNADVEPPSDAKKRAEPGVDGAALQLADAIELSADTLRKTLLRQLGLPAQLLNGPSESGMGGGTWLAAARRRHPTREPVRQDRSVLADLPANSILIAAASRTSAKRSKRIFKSAISRTPSVPIECRAGKR